MPYAAQVVACKQPSLTAKKETKKATQTTDATADDDVEAITKREMQAAAARNTFINKLNNKRGLWLQNLRDAMAELIGAAGIRIRTQRRIEALVNNRVYTSPLLILAPFGLYPTRSKMQRAMLKRPKSFCKEKERKMAWKSNKERP